MVIGVDDHAIGPSEPIIQRDRDIFHRDSIVDIAADYRELAGSDADDEIAMSRETARGQLAESDRTGAAPQANQIPDLRRIDLDPL